MSLVGPIGHCVIDMRVFVSGGSGFVGRSGGGQHAPRALDVVEGAAHRLRSKALDRGGAAIRASHRQHLVAARDEGLDHVTAGVRRFIHIGTEAVLFDGHDLIDFDETQPYPVRQRFFYSETKAEAERLVLAADDSTLTALSLRPRLIWGPRDATVLPAILRMHAAGSFAWIDHGRRLSSTTHVRNLAHAIGLALATSEIGGKAYFVLDDGTRSIHEFLVALAKTQGVELGERNVPGWLARAAATLLEATWRLLGLRGTPPLTRFAVAMMSSTITICDDRARRELGYAPVIAVERGLAELAQKSSRPPAAGLPMNQ